MPAETILFLDDQMHISKTAVTMGAASSTDGGYHASNVRDTNYATAWKPVNGTADEHPGTIDGGSTGWLGSLAYVAIAYDARGADQNEIELRVDVSDNPAGTFATNKATFTLNKTRPTCDYALIASTGNKRYYRLYQLNADRGGGTIPAKVYAWTMFRESDVYNVDVTYVQDALAPGSLGLRSKVARLETAGGIGFTNRYGSTDQDFELNFDRATLAWWTALRDKFFGLDNDHRAFFLQMEGLRGDAKANFAMVRQRGGQWTSQRPFVDQYDTGIQVASEPFRP